MDTQWIELQTQGIEVEENEVTTEEFELLLRDWVEEQHTGG